MGTFKAASGSISTSKTLSESSPESFEVDFAKVTLGSTQNSSYIFTVTVADNLGETAEAESPKITINTKPSWNSGSSISINDINNKNVVVSISATSAKILAKTAKTKIGARLMCYTFENVGTIKSSKTEVVNTEATSASYTFRWEDAESKQSKFTCFITDVLEESSDKLTSTYSLIVNTRPKMKGSIYVEAPDKDDKRVTSNMMTTTQLYIKTVNNGKTIKVSWDKPTLYNSATVKNYNLYVSTDNRLYRNGKIRDQAETVRA